MGSYEWCLNPPPDPPSGWKITNERQKMKLWKINNKSYFHWSVTLTKGFGCFWDTFGRVKGLTGTQLGGGNLLIGLSMHSQHFFCLFVCLFEKCQICNPKYHMYVNLSNALSQIMENAPPRKSQQASSGLRSKSISMAKGEALKFEWGWSHRMKLH